MAEGAAGTKLKREIEVTVVDGDPLRFREPIGEDDAGGELSLCVSRTSIFYRCGKRSVVLSMHDIHKMMAMALDPEEEGS